MATPKRIFYSPALLVGLLLGLFTIAAFLLRVIPPHGFVFATDPIRFTGVDAYFYMRQVDSLVQNFPVGLTFDPYLRFDWGMNLGLPHIFVVLMGTLTWLLTLGNTTQAAVDNVAVYIPAVLGALTVIPVFFTGRALLNRWAGLVAAAAIAVLPGEFLGRSILGFADRHVLDNLLIAVCLMFYVLAFRAARQRGSTLRSYKEGSWRQQVRPAIYSALAGVSMGLFMLDWKGSVLFLLIVAAYVGFQTFVNHLQSRPSDHLWLVSTASTLVAGAMALPVNQSMAYFVPFILALLTGPALGVISRLFKKANARSYLFPLVTGGSILVVAIFLWLTAPTIFEPIIGSMNLFTVKETENTVLEMQPILLPGGKLSGDVVWGNFTTGIFFALSGIVIMAWRFVKKRDPEEALLFLIWTVFVLVATLFARRFAQMMAPNVAVLTGYCSALALYLFNLGNSKIKTIPPPRKAKVNLNARRMIDWGRVLRIGLAVIVIFFAAVYPNLGFSTEIAAQPAFAPDQGWIDALKWLKTNTPEPLGNDLYYSQSFPDFKYPGSAYSIISWWDYGYWIVRIGHRMPFCDPGGGGREAVAKFLSAPDETTGRRYASAMAGRYAVIDGATAVGKFHAVLTYAGKNQNQYFEQFLVRNKNEVTQVLLYYPAYYRTMTARLYNFDGREVPATRAVAVGYAERTDGTVAYKEITSSQLFTSYEDAAAWVAVQKSGKFVIASDNPFLSPVAQPALTAFKLVHGSPLSISIGDKTTPSVKVFQYLPAP